MSNGVAFIGLDFETSGTSHETAAPIQIGLATRTEIFGGLVGGWDWDDEYEWSYEAQEIHGIERAELEGCPNAPSMDSQASLWLTQALDLPPKKIIAVGWNVAAFDFPFLRRYFPATASGMSYRSVDLNAILFGIVEARMTDPYNRVWDYYGLKKAAKQYAAECVQREFPDMFTGEEWHDAAYDAIASLHAYDFLTYEIRTSEPYYGGDR